MRFNLDAYIARDQKIQILGGAIRCSQELGVFQYAECVIGSCTFYVMSKGDMFESYNAVTACFTKVAANKGTVYLRTGTHEPNYNNTYGSQPCDFARVCEIQCTTEI